MTWRCRFSLEVENAVEKSIECRLSPDRMPLATVTTDSPQITAM